MIEQLTAQKSVYEIKKSLGNGLTSEVYKAFRKDSAGFTCQTVALKLIKSRKDVQILQKEFENLNRVNSKYCVQVLAWENFEQGPALVLEYIDGVTLDQLWTQGGLDRDEIVEIFTQIRLGLLSLHRNQVFHGDLNLKNIMLTKQGLVKIIDFGFGSDKEQCLTPEFAAPLRLQGHPPTAKTDWTSYEKMADYLFGNSTVPYQLKNDIPRGWRRRRLSKKILRIMNTTTPKTLRWIPKKSTPRIAPIFFKMVSVLVFLFLLLVPNPKGKSPQFHSLEIRSRNWFQYSINKLPLRYGPRHPHRLRHGHYNVTWKTATSKGQEVLKVSRSKTILLRPEGGRGSNFSESLNL